MGDVAVIGSLNYDTSVRTTRIPAVGETVLGSSIAYHSGGKGANQAYACAKAGAKTCMLGAVGDDTCAEILENSLKSANVCTENLLKFQNVSSGNAIVTVDDAGNNAIIAIPGANYQILPQHIYEFRETLRAVSVALLQLEIPIETIYAAIETAKQEDCLVVLNPAPVQSIQNEFLAMVDYVIPNETELHQLVAGNASAEDKALQLIADGVKNVIVTLGEKGVLYVDAHKNVRKFAAKRVNAVDTVGAGDCFCGYFTAALAKGEKVETAIDEAIAAAAISVTRTGAQESIPTRAEVMQLIGEENGNV